MPLAPPPGVDRLLCGVNSFGIGGSNAFALLAGADIAPYAVHGGGAAGSLPAPTLPALLIPLESTSAGALAAGAAAWAAFGAKPASRFSAALQRPPPGFEGAAVEGAVRNHLASLAPIKPKAFRSALVVSAGGGNETHLSLARATPLVGRLPYLPLSIGRAPRVGFAFAGQGALAPGAGDQQYGALPSFRAAAHEFSAVYAATTAGSGSVVTLLHPDCGSATLPWHDADAGGAPPTSSSDVRLALPASTLLQFATFKALAAAGLEVACAAGHSAGEALAAHAARLLTLGQLAQAIAARAAAMAGMPAGGGMAALTGPEEAITNLLAAQPAFHVAAVNDDGQVTVGGPAESLEALLAAAPAAGVRGTRLRVAYAFHGPDVEAVRPAFFATLASVGWVDADAPVVAADGSSAFLSSTDGVGSAPFRLDAAHWWANMRTAVQWSGAASRLAASADLVLECSPRATLAPCWGGGTATTPIFPTARAPGTALADTFKALAEAWCAGTDLAWPALLSGPVPGAPILPIPWNHEVRICVETDTFGAPPILNHSARGRSEMPLKLVGKVAHLNAKLPAQEDWVHLPEPGKGGGSGGGAGRALRPTTPGTARPAPAAVSPPSPAAAAEAPPPPPPPPAERVEMAIAVTPVPTPSAFPATATASFYVPSYCADHVIMGNACVPGVSYSAWAAQLAVASGLASSSSILCMEGLVVKRMLGVEPSFTGDGSPVRLELNIGADGEVVARADRGGGSGLLAKPAATGSLSVLETVPVDVASRLDDLTARLAAVTDAAAAGAPPPAGLLPVSARHFYRYNKAHTPLQHAKPFHLAGDMLSKEGVAYARVTVPATTPGALVGDTGVLNPVVLDACTHAGLLSGPIPTSFYFALPVSYGRIFILPGAAAATGSVHTYAAMRFLPPEPAMIVTDLYVLDILVATADGTPCLLIEGLKLHTMMRPVPVLMCVPVSTPAGGVDAGAVDAAFPPGSVGWVVPDGGATSSFQPPAHRLAGGDALAPPGAPDLKARLAPARLVVLAGSVDPQAGAAALAAAPPGAALVVVLLPPATLETARMAGWARCAIAEHARSRRLCLLSAPHQHSAAAISAAALTLAASGEVSGQARLEADGRSLVTERLQPGWTPALDTPQARPTFPVVAPGPRWRYSLASPGQIGSLAPRVYEPPPLEPGQMRFTVSAVALQFKDVMLALDMLKGVPGDIGMEAVGTICEVHPVTAAAYPHLTIGQRVIAVLNPPHGALASHATAHGSFTNLVPAGLSDADAVATPSSWVTVLYSLRDRGRLARGESILIHSAAGGVGSAAMAYAASLGCRIIASAGSPAKRAALAVAPGVVAVIDSRCADDWGAAVADATGGAGVDVVLNSLAGDLQVASLALLAPGGRFVEIGKRDALTGGSVSQAALLMNGSFVSAHIDMLVARQPDNFSALIAEVVEAMGTGTIAPLKSTVLPMAQTGTALRQISRGLHTGKLVLAVPTPGAWAPPGMDGAALYKPTPANLPPPPLTAVDADHAPLPMDESGTLVVSGGTSGVGMVFAGEAMRLGAKHVLILTSRPVSAMPRVHRSWLEARASLSGASLTFRTTDLTNLIDVARAVRSVPGTTPVQLVAHFSNVYVNDPSSAPLPACNPAWRVKVDGALNLHLATAPMSSVRGFLVASSMARVTGAEVQATYCGANEALRCLALARNAAGLPATVVDLPAVASVGHLSRWSCLPEMLFMRARGIDLVDWRTTVRAILDVLGDGRPGGPAGGQAVTIFAGTTLENERLRPAFVAEGSPVLPPAPVVGVPALPDLAPPTRAIAAALGGGLVVGAAPPVAAVLQPPAAVVLRPPEAAVLPPPAPAVLPPPAPAFPPPQPLSGPVLPPPPVVAASPMVPVLPVAPAAAAPAPPTSSTATIAPADSASIRTATVAKLCELLDLTPDDIADHVPLVSLGMDSLSAVELANWAAETYGTPPPSLSAGDADAGRLEMLATMTLAKLVVAQAEAASGKEVVGAGVEAPVAAVVAAAAAPAPAVLSSPPAPAAWFAPPGPPPASVLPPLPPPPPPAVLAAPPPAPPAWATPAPQAAAPAPVLPPPVPAPALVVPTPPVALVVTSPAPAVAPPLAPPVASSRPPTATHTDTASIRTATVDKLCELLDLTRDDIADHVPLISLGMDSLSAVELANWAAETYGTPAPTLAASDADAGRLEMMATMTLAKLVAAQAEAASGMGVEAASVAVAPVAAPAAPAPVIVAAVPAPVQTPVPVTPPAVVAAPPPPAVVAATPPPAVVVAPPPPPHTLAFEAEVDEEAAPAPPPPVVYGGGGGGAPAAVASSSSSFAPAATPLPAIPAFSITREFDGATVFLTGATGFLGSVLLEQLLRCTDVAAVHCLVRARAGSSAKKRFKALLADKLFARVRAAKPGAPAKVFLVEGNAAAPFLGTQPGELDALAPRLDFILNVAAQITPHAHIRTAVSVNAGSAQRVVALAAACPHLKALVHVSSAYVVSMAPGSAPLKGEVLYPLPAMGDDGDPHPASVNAVLDRLRDASPAAAAEMGAAMMADAGLTDQYVVSKLLAEHVVTDGAAAANLPAIIVRPSFIAPAAGPPVEGYFIGRAGGMALASLSAVEYGSLLPVGVGVEDVEAARICIVPVDIVAASIMAAAASTAVRAREVRPAHHPAPTPIINICTSGTPSPLTVGAASAAMAGLSGVAKAILKKTLPGKDSLAGLIAGEYMTSFGRLVTEAESKEAGLAMVRALRFECGGLMALEASLAPAEHVLFPLQWGERPVGCAGGAPPGTTTVLGGRTWASTIKASQTYAAQLFKSR